MTKYIVIKMHGRSQYEIQGEVNRYANEYAVTHVTDQIIIMTAIGGQ